MLKLKKLVALLLVSTMVLSPSAYSAGAMGIVFDPTNYTQNIITAGQSVIAETTRVKQLIEQVKSAIAMAKQIKNLPQTVVNEMVGESMKQLQDLQGYASSINQLYGDIQSIKGELSGRFDEQKLSGLSWGDYMENEAKRIARGQTESIARATMDRTMLENMNKDFEQVRSWQDKIGETEGTHGAMQLMNAQVNKMVSQNAQLIGMLAAQDLNKVAQDTDAQAKKNASLDAEEKLRALQLEEAAKQRSELDKIRAKTR